MTPKKTVKNLDSILRLVYLFVSNVEDFN